MISDGARNRDQELLVNDDYRPASTTIDMTISNESSTNDKKDQLLNQAFTGSAAESLFSLEKDKAAKQASESGRPLALDISTKAAQAASSLVFTATQLEREILTEAFVASPIQHSVHPGAVAVAELGGTAAVTFTSLERDIAAKCIASPGRSSQLEQDVLAKTSSMPVDSAVQLGEDHGSYAPASYNRSSASKSDFSALERDIAAKSKASQGRLLATQLSAIEGRGLKRLEQDVLAKASAGREGHSRPGASHEVGLTRLEQDVLVKASATRRTGRAPDVNGELSIAALERDVALKSVAQTRLVNDAPRLDHLEQEILAKASGKLCGPSSQPGVVSVDGVRSLSAVERDVSLKRQGHRGDNSTRILTPPADRVRESLNDLERDVHVKITVGAGADRPGLVAVDPPIQPANASLNTLESDILAKMSIGPDGSETRNPGAAHITELPKLLISGASMHSVDSALSRQISAPRSSTSGCSTRLEKRNNLSALEDDILRKSYGHVPSSPSVVMSRRQPQSLKDAENEILSAPSAESDLAEPREYTESRHQSPAVMSVVVPEAPLEGERFSEYGVQDVVVPTDGIEAFVADNVVDATGVTVIASEEEEEKRNWSRQKKRLCFLGIFFVAIVIALVVAIAVAIDKRENGLRPMPAPSGAPTAAPTVAPTSSAFAALIQNLSSISVENAFATKDSFQYMAAEWLYDEDTYGIALSSSNPAFLERYALAVVYFALGGPLWHICGQSDETCTGNSGINNWLSPTDICTWYGITCGADKFVEEFVFRAGTDSEFSENDLMLDGELPREITLLTQLSAFIADGFQISGSITDTFSNSSKLQTLILSNNNISGEIPNSFAINNPELQTIIFSNNQMTGTLPSTIGQLARLVFLQLNGNAFGGTINANIFAMTTSLQRLELQSNQISGQFPRSWYALKDLEILRADDTNLRGLLRSEIGQMDNLRELDLSRSLMSGSLPSELYRLANLTALRLSDALFTGSLAEDIRFLNRTLQVAYFDGNGLTGSIPVDGLGALTSLNELQLYGNDLTGAITSTSRLCGLVFDSQIQLIRTDCSIACDCCAKCEPGL
ncbi:hypothetical protein MPSEU_000895400 [Mayamaea pseudoterrestris]|nr:hypothetical protein MPSEU_000895400 [Mayamaea pseudoterrestris]